MFLSWLSWNLAQSRREKILKSRVSKVARFFATDASFVAVGAEAFALTYLTRVLSPLMIPQPETINIRDRDIATAKTDITAFSFFILRSLSVIKILKCIKDVNLVYKSSTWQVTKRSWRMQNSGYIMMNPFHWCKQLWFELFALVELENECRNGVTSLLQRLNSNIKSTRISTYWLLLNW